MKRRVDKVEGAAAHSSVNVVRGVELKGPRWAARGGGQTHLNHIYIDARQMKPVAPPLQD
jgi:hypothetical protein